MNETSRYPMVSVILPSFNHENYVIEAIKSIENQDYPNIELIIIDDGSSDSSVTLIKNYCHEKSHKRVFKTRNTGVAKTLNEGINLSTGDFIAFFASDDVWHPEKIRLQVQHLTNTKTTKLIFTECRVIDETGNFKENVHYSDRVISEWAFEDVLYKADLPAMSPMVRTSEIKKCGGFPEEFGVEDFPMWCSMLKHGGFARVLPQALTYYRMHGENTHLVNSVKILRGHFEVADHFSKNLAIRHEIISEWRMRNANHLAIHHKLEALSYFMPNIYRIRDPRYIRILAKLLLKW